MKLLRRFLRCRVSFLSLLRVPIWLTARHYGTFIQIRDLISKLDMEAPDRTTFVQTVASRNLLDNALTYADVGARGGLLAYLRPFEEILHPIFFEPDIEEFERMQVLYKDKSVSIINAALSDCSGTGTLYLTKKRACSSLLHPSGHSIGLLANSIDMYGKFYSGIERLEVDKTIEVDTLRLDEVLPISKTIIDILKIDTQGLEFEVLNGLGEHRPFLICAECSTTEIYKNQRSVFAVGSLLESLGYFPIRFMESHITPPTAAKWRNSIQLHGDVIFVPDNSSMGRAIIERDVEKWFAALCMHGYMDYALWQIEELDIPKPPLVTQTEELLRSR